MKEAPSPLYKCTVVARGKFLYPPKSLQVLVYMMEGGGHRYGFS